MSTLLEEQLRDLFAADAAAAPPAPDLVAATRRGVRDRRIRVAWAGAAWGAAASIAAAAVAVIVVWTPAPPEPFPDVAAPPTGPVRAPGTLSETPGFGPGTRLSIRPVSQVLGPAAETAARGPDVLPRADQYLYLREVGRDGRVNAERWYSVDGTRDGLGFNRESNGMARFLSAGCRNGRYISGTEKGEACTPMPAYLPDLPTDAGAMVRYLNQHNAHLNNDPAQNKTNGIAKDMWQLATSRYLRPAQRAALYQAAARIEGITVVEGAVDATGRKGTGVSWRFGKDTVMWIFDPVSYAYLGTGTDTTVQAIVDEVGQRP
ncbi:CU044_5270 family protein [Micromonospora sp. HK10]|uniref:CU044_5270 family protein n=1 Tax=Micromonospora sp. HK10 TaxID=1538294 RepID=UPI0006978CE3|nr:CU044_5270 family protein [Micromonospora sp. HK10]